MDSEQKSPKDNPKNTKAPTVQEAPALSKKAVEDVVEKASIHFFHTVGENTVSFFHYLSGLWNLTRATMVSLFNERFPLHAFLEQFFFIGNKSFALISLISIFTGMVFALQFAVGLERFGLKIYIGQIIGLAIARELGPVLTALMLAARVGSGIAAELGSMVVTEQVLAIDALGANSVQKLVVPRVLATTLAVPILSTMGSVISIMGGLIVTVLEAGVTPNFYMDQILRTVEVDDYFSGLAKTVFFGFFIGLIACYEGLKTKGGTAGVGKATTYAVVIASLMIFISDFFLTKLFILL